MPFERAATVFALQRTPATDKVYSVPHVTKPLVCTLPLLHILRVEFRTFSAVLRVQFRTFSAVLRVQFRTFSAVQFRTFLMNWNPTS